MGDGRNVELQKILAGLNGTLSNPALSNSAHHIEVQIPGLGFASPRPESRHTPDAPAPTTSAALFKAVNPPSDPSKITTWPAALKYITKYVVTNEVTATRIKHLIAQQAKHERVWWAGREAIATSQLGREGRQKEAAALLKSLGGLAIPVVVESDPLASKRELEAFDQKVYSELVKMSVDFDRQLRGLGVPFFAIKHELVISDNCMGQFATGKVDKGELRELQKKVLQTLEDLLLD